MSNIKKYLLGFIIGISVISTASYASNYGSIGELFDFDLTTGDVIGLNGSNIIDKTLTGGKIADNLSLGGNLNVEGNLRSGGGEATGIKTVGIGYGANAIGDYSLALGGKAGGKSAISIKGDASNEGSISIGISSTAPGSYGIAMGYSADAIGDQSIGIGFGAYSPGYSGVSVGRNARVEKSMGIAIGQEASSKSVRGTAIGYKTQTNGDNSVAIGYMVQTEGEGTTIIGNNGHASADDAFAIAAGSGWDFNTAGEGIIYSVKKNGDVVVKGELTSSGNLGVGTTTPDFKLQVDVQGENNGIILNNTELNNQIGLKTNAYGPYLSFDKDTKTWIQKRPDTDANPNHLMVYNGDGDIIINPNGEFISNANSVINGKLEVGGNIILPYGSFNSEKSTSGVEYVGIKTNSNEWGIMVQKDGSSYLMSDGVVKIMTNPDGGYVNGKLSISSDIEVSGKIKPSAGFITQTASGDWNNYLTTGFYQGSGLTNECPGSSWRYVTVNAHNNSGTENNSWVSQTCNDFSGNGIYQRNKSDGTWGAWRKMDTIWEKVLPTDSNYFDKNCDRRGTFNNSDRTYLVPLSVIYGGVWLSGNMAFNSDPAHGVVRYGDKESYDYYRGAYAESDLEVYFIEKKCY